MASAHPDAGQGRRTAGLRGLRVSAPPCGDRHCEMDTTRTAASALSLATDNQERAHREALDITADYRVLILAASAVSKIET